MSRSSLAAAPPAQARSGRRETELALRDHRRPPQTGTIGTTAAKPHDSPAALSLLPDMRGRPFDCPPGRSSHDPSPSPGSAWRPGRSRRLPTAVVIDQGIAAAAANLVAWFSRSAVEITG